VTCETEHKWVFQHTVYWIGEQCYGSSAYRRVYGDRYYCERCLETRVVNPRQPGDSTYEKPLPGTFPK
jgi:hypothetical protein